MARSTLLFFALLSTASVPALAENAHYTIDPAHTYPSFEADHMGISVWRGKLDKSSGGVDLDKAAGTGTVDVTIDLSSIDFGLDALNTWATGKDFFDVALYPTARFVADRLVFEGDKVRSASGILTLLGKARTVVLSANRFNCYVSPVANRQVCGGDFETTIKRSEFGITWGLNFGFEDNVKLLVQVEAIAWQPR